MDINSRNIEEIVRQVLEGMKTPTGGSAPKAPATEGARSGNIRSFHSVCL